MRRRTRYALVALLLGALGAVPAAAREQRAGGGARMLARLAAAFPLLGHNRPRRPPAEIMSGNRSTGMGLAPSRAVVQRLPDGATLWMVPGAVESCVAVLDAPPAAGTALLEHCQSDRTVLRQGVVLLVITTTHEYVVGVRPGAARTVSATADNGRTIHVPSRYGAYALTTRRPRYLRAISTPGGPYRLPPSNWVPQAQVRRGAAR